MYTKKAASKKRDRDEELKRAEAELSAYRAKLAKGIYREIDKIVDAERLDGKYALMSTRIMMGTKEIISAYNGARLRPVDPENPVRVYAKTKLVTSYHVGRRDMSTEHPIFTSDDWDAYKNALVEVYGVEEQPEYKGRGRPPNPKKVPPPDLKYGQVVKYREGEEVTDVKKRVVFGNEEEVLSALKLAGNSITLTRLT